MGTYTGIDIGSRYTKLIEIETKPRPRILNAVIFDTPYVSGKDKGLPDQIDGSSLCNEIVKHIPLKKLKVTIMGVNISAMYVTTIDLLLPRMSAKELSTAAINEARRKMIPASTANHTFEWSFLGERIVGKISRSEVLVVRSEKDYIQQTLDIFKSLENHPALISPGGFVLPNIMPKDLWKKDESAVFVDLGDSSLCISIARDEKTVFLRNIVYGVKDIIRDIASQLGLDEKEIAGIIQEYGVPQVSFDLKDKVAIAEEIMRQKYEAGENPRGQSNYKVNLLELRMLWDPHINRIVQELRRSLAYYKEQSEGRRVEEIFFCGGGSQIKNLISALTRSVGGECKVILPFKCVNIPIEKQFPEESVSTPIFVGALGLAYSVLIKDKKEATINFLPLDLKKKEMITARKLVLRFIYICLIFTFSLALINTGVNNYSSSVTLKDIESNLNKVKKVANRLKDLGRREEKLRLIFPQIDEIIKKNRDFARPLGELTKIVPPEITLAGLSIFGGGNTELGRDMQRRSAGIGASQGIVLSPQGQAAAGAYSIEIKAEVFADYETAGDVIKEFQNRLAATRYFSGINITPLELEEVSSLRGSGGNGRLVLTDTKARQFTLTAEIFAK